MVCVFSVLSVHVRASIQCFSSVSLWVHPNTKYILFLCSVYYLTVNAVRSTALRGTPPNASVHHRNATGCLEMTASPSVRCTSDAGKIKVTCDNLQISLSFFHRSVLLLRLPDSG